MSLVFAGSRAAFYRQHFNAVDMSMRPFERSIHLNPHPKPCKPKQNVDEVVIKEENHQQKNE